MSDPTAETVSTNPYLNARLHWNDRTRVLMSHTRLWQTMALICLLITLVAVAGAIHIASQSKFVPYVVEVDKLGQALAVNPAQTAAPVDPKIVNASLAAFISSARLVTPDIALQRKAIFSIYAMMHDDDPATAKMTEWLNGSPSKNPFERAAKETVETEIISVLQQSPDSWQVEWTEQVFDRKGVPTVKPYRMRALVNIAFAPPTSETTEAQVRMNPLGIFVRDFSWSKIGG